jgi:hypothetical protein
MLVDLVSWFREPQQRGEALGAAGVFSTFGFGRKSYAGHIFRTESEALAERPAEEGRRVQGPQAKPDGSRI